LVAQGVVTNSFICAFLLAEKMGITNMNNSLVTCRFAGRCPNPHVELNTITAAEAEQAARISTTAGSYLQNALITGISGKPALFK
jgi:hypothetical protein